MARASALINFASVVHEFSMTARMGSHTLLRVVVPTALPANRGV